mgnify:FL=1
MFNFFSTIFDVLATISFILFYPIVFLVRLHTKKDSGTRLTKLGLFKSPELKENVIMFHAVSVGEVLSLEKLLKQTKKQFPDYKLVLTTGTKTGQELAHKKYSEIVDFITYFPFDISFAINNFLNKINPSIVLIAETELWPNFAIQCKKRNIPLLIINGRISDKSLGSYKNLKLFFSPILNLYSKIYTQSELDKERFIEIGTSSEKVEVMKNLKFDIDKTPSDIDLKKGENKVLIAGSTHSGENEILISAFDKLRQSHKNLKFIIAPRHLERVKEIEQILSSYNYSYGYRSKNNDFTNFDIIILDTLGELKKAYAFSDIAFIGGSFNKTGGHNPLEATVYSVPTITGPSIKNFRDIYSILTKAGAAVLVNNQSELEKTLDKFLSDSEFYNNTKENCKNIFQDQQGALEFVIDKIKSILNI